MKLALIAPRFPPDLCGVGDHSVRLAESLSGLGHDVVVWTARKKPKTGASDVRAVPGPWGAAALARVSRAVAAEKPDAVIVQYTPYLYSPSGGLSNIFLPPWLLALRTMSRAPVVLMAHEMHYPIEASAAGLFRGLPQAQVFFALALAADHVFFTYEAPWKRFQKLMPWRASKFHWLPVGANVEPAKKQRPKIGHAHVMLHFGGSHPTHQISWALAALEKALDRKELASDVKLVFIGNSKSKVEAELRARGHEGLRAHVKALGELPATEVSAWLSRADLVLAPFSDGVSTRRSSVMAALAHARPVLSTQGASTDKDVPWGEACRLVPCGASEGFASAAVELLLSNAKRKKIAAYGAALYDECFAWPGIAQILVESIQRSTSK